MSLQDDHNKIGKALACYEFILMKAREMKTSEYRTLCYLLDAPVEDTFDLDMVLTALTEARKA